MVSLIYQPGADPAEAGINIGDINVDRVGAWQRVPTSDKPHKRNGAVCVFSAHPLEFFFKNHATEVSGVYKEPSISTVPKHPKPKVNPEIGYAKAAEVARQNWRTAQPVDRHPYLEAKQVQSYGLRQLGRRLLIPAYDAHGHLWTYQAIDEDGQKRFLKGGRKQGCYFPIGSKPKRWLVLAEGYATGASLYESLGLPVGVCFDCGNLQSVAEALAKQLPNTSMVIAADNDVHTPGNPGITKAQAVMNMVKQVEEVIWPEFSEAGLTDWNDAFQAAGSGIVREIFHAKGVRL